MILPFPPPKNVTTFPQMIQYINGLTDVGEGGILGIIFLIVIGGMLFMMMRSYGNERAIGVTALVISILGFLLRMMDLINDYVLYICIALLILGIWLLIKESSNYDA